MMRNKVLIALALLLALTACSSSDDDKQPPDSPPADDPVAGPDCLGDITADGTTYCVDPDTRTIIVTLADGTIDWTVNLADSTSSPKIETLVLINEQPWLVADSGRQIGLIRREQNDVLYGQVALESGGFFQTSSSRDYDYQRDERALPAIGIGDSALIITDVYELIKGADRDLDDSWQFVGASLLRILPSVGNYTGNPDFISTSIQAQRLYPDLHVQALSRTTGGEVYVEFGESSERLTADTLLPTASDPARALIGGKPHEAVTPFLFTALRGDGLDEYAQQMLALGGQIRTTASESLVIESNAPEEIPPHGTDYDVLERIDYVCMGGGELGLERTESVTYNSGIFLKTEIQEHYRYSDCHVTIGEDDPLLPSGPYLLDGEFVYDNLDDQAFQNYRQERTQHEWRQLSLDSPRQRSSLTTAQIIRDIGFGMSGPNPGIYTTRITSHDKRVDGEITLLITDGNYVSNLNQPFEQPSSEHYQHIVASGTITASETGNQAIIVSIDPPIAQSIDVTDVDQFSAPNVRSTGRMLATAADGSTMTVTAVEALAVYTGMPPLNASGALDYRVADDDAMLRETKNFNSLVIPISLR